MIGNKYEQKICGDHNLPLEFANPDNSKPNLYACTQCIIDYYKITPIQQIQQSNEIIIKKFEQQLDQNSEIWNISIHSLYSLREAFTKSIKIIENIIDVIRNQIQQTTNEFKNMNANQKEEIQKSHESYLQTQLIHQRNIIQQIEVLKQNSSIEKLIQGLNKINLQKLDQDDKKLIQKNQNKDQTSLYSVQQPKAKRYEYQLISESSIKQEEACGAISFNYDGSIIVAGCQRIIQVFEFKNKQLKKVQSIESHYGFVSCLQFMKKSNQFISGSLDNTINIWQAKNGNQYINIQTLEGHKAYIQCIIIKSNDCLIISGSYDKSIIFWELNDNKWQLDQSSECTSSVQSLSFNDSNTKMISCEKNNLIQVFEQQGKKWIISQMIKVEQWGQRLCFINEDQFIFLPWKSKQLFCYKLDQKTNKFQKQLEVEMSNSDDLDFLGFPMKFVKSKNLLIVKNCQFVSILRRQENFVFIENQSIQFNTSYLEGNVSEDGNFMITWDNQTHQYQVRYLKEIL